MISQPCPTEDLYETGRGTGRGARDHRASPGPFPMTSQRLDTQPAGDGAALLQAAAVPGGASRVPDAPPHPIKPHPSAQPCRIRGVVYPSQRTAAQALGVSDFAISMAISEGREDRAGMGQHRGGNHVLARPVYMNDKRWPSMTDAARALGVSVAAISTAVKQGRATVRPGKPRHV